MKCSIEGCPGVYERRHVAHTVRHRDRLIVIDQVPAQVCSVCGDVLFDAATTRGIEDLLASRNAPDRTAPVYDYGHRLAG